MSSSSPELDNNGKAVLVSASLDRPLSSIPRSMLIALSSDGVLDIFPSTSILDRRSFAAAILSLDRAIRSFAESAFNDDDEFL